MMGRHNFLLFILKLTTVFLGANSQLYLREENNVTKDSTIQITSYIRTYRQGPIENHFLVSQYDDIRFTAGGIPGVFDALKNDSNNVSVTVSRQWAVWSQDEHKRESCVMSRVYNYGEEAMFKCVTPGIYRAYVYDEKDYFGKREEFINNLKNTSDDKESSFSDVYDAKQLGPKDVQYPEEKMFWSNRRQLLPFNLYPITAQPEQLDYNNFIEHIKTLDKDLIAVSDPFSIEISDYCYYWNYYINLTDKKPIENSTESLWIFSIDVWIIEPNAMSYDEISIYDVGKETKVSDYSKLLTRRFEAKGLVPCIRKPHGAVEVVDIKWFSDEESHQGYPFWRMRIKIHADTVISTLSDISITVSARQRVSIYKCFVGDTRIFFEVRSYQFLHGEKSNAKTAVNLGFSNIGSVRKDYVENNLEYFYGHGVIWSGPKASRPYQPGSTRTDLLAITNPCKAQEFVAVAGGRVALATKLLELRDSSMVRIFLPGLGGEDVSDYEKWDESRHTDYFATTDVAFTPTHLVFLLTNSEMYLHPYVPSERGIGYLSKTQKFRLQSLVKRRWCAQTGYLTHNMQVPAYSNKGNFIIIQIFPIEGNINVWARPAPESCATKGFVIAFDPENEKNAESERNREDKIHFHEKVSHSDDVGREVRPTKVDKPRKIRRDPNELETYLANNGELFDEHDEHFPPEFSNPAGKRQGDNYTYFNHAVIYKLDDGGSKMIRLLKSNGISPNGTEITLDNIQFTAVEKRFIVAVKFSSAVIKQRDFIAMISTMSATNYPVKIDTETSESESDLDLETVEVFPGCLLVRKNISQFQNVYPRDPDDIDLSINYKSKTPLPLVLYTLNTAIPTYVTDLGNVYVFASLDGRFARPLSFYKREDILGNNSKKAVASPLFSKEGDETLHDIVVTEQGTLSILWRKDPVEKGEIKKLAQSIAIGSVYTLEPLREMKPFTSGSSVFQWATPDNEILYGRYTEVQRPRFESCHPNDTERNSMLRFCVAQPNIAISPHWCTHNTTDYLNPTLASAGSRSPLNKHVTCQMWKYDPKILYEAEGEEITDADLKIRLEKAAIAYKQDTTRQDLKKCLDDSATNCLRQTNKKGKRLCDPGKDDSAEKYPNCTLPPPKHQSIMNIHGVELLSIPYYNLLKGSLQFRSFDDHHLKVGKTDKKPENADDKTLEEEQREGTQPICPFASFSVTNTDFDYAEVGYSTRITAAVSYFGKNVPTEADLLVEFENVVGVRVSISSSLFEERDQTTVTKTIDIEFHMTDSDLARMENAHKIVNTKSSSRSADKKDDARIFSITIRPSVVNLYCGKNEVSKTLQINVGCNPFTTMRLIAEATPLRRIVKKLKKGKDDRTSSGEPDDFVVVKGNLLSIPREDIHHRQRKRFKCDARNDTYCHVQYADLYKTNVFEVSWRDPFFPVFEQFLTGYTRRVTANIVVYDLFGEPVSLNLTRLKAGCYHNANNWYEKLSNQQVFLGTNVTVSEDIYAYYKDCFDQSTDRQTPALLSNESFRLHNLTNKNAIKFLRKPNPRNKIYVFRAVVVNTYYNRFTYCNNLDTIFLVRIIGIPTPRQALLWWFYVVMSLAILAVLAFTYIHFSFCYPWKGEAVPAPAPVVGGGRTNDEEITDENADILNEDYLRDEEHVEFDFTQRVRDSDGFFEKFAKRIYALARWKKRATDTVEKRHVSVVKKDD